MFQISVRREQCIIVLVGSIRMEHLYSVIPRHLTEHRRHYWKVGIWSVESRRDLPLCIFIFVLKEKKNKEGPMNDSVRVRDVLECKDRERERERNLTWSLAFKTENFSFDLDVIACSLWQRRLPSRRKLNSKRARFCSLPAQCFVSRECNILTMGRKKNLI
jgi:hypothetical protein